MELQKLISGTYTRFLKYNIALYGLLLLFSCSEIGDNPNIKEATATTMVYIDDGDIQCEYKGATPFETGQILLAEGIDVLESYCGTTGNYYTAMCGAGTSSINLHVIKKIQINRALELGFNLVSDLETENGSGYSIVDCNRE